MQNEHHHLLLLLAAQHQKQVLRQGLKDLVLVPVSDAVRERDRNPKEALIPRLIVV
jgi:hypothetical protein